MGWYKGTTWGGGGNANPWTSCNLTLIHKCIRDGMRPDPSHQILVTQSLQGGIHILIITRFRNW